MKTAILTAAMMILMTVTYARTNDVNVNPGTPEKVEFKASIVQPTNQTINFRISNPEADKVVMKIYSEKKVKVFHRTTKSAKEYSIKCDMSQIESGIYTCVVVRNGQEELRKQVVILN
jgi:hypothetical protein